MKNQIKALVSYTIGLLPKPLEKRILNLIRRTYSRIRSGDFSLRKIRTNWRARQETLRTIRNDRRPVIFAFVNNPAVNDSRVLKEAKTLNSGPQRVVLYAAKHRDWPDRHMFEGIEIRRFDMFADPGKIDAETQRELVSIFGQDIIDEVNVRLEEFRSGAALSDPDRVAIRAVYPFNAAVAMARLRFDETPVAIHSHDLYPLGGAVLLAKRTGAKVIFDAHEIETERMPPMPSPLKDFIDRLERRLLSKTDRVIVCCASSADFYSRRFQGERPSVVMNAPGEKSPGGRKFDIRSACGIDNDVPLIIFTGGIGGEGRGLHFAVRALAELPGYHLAILGPRHRQQDKWLQEQAIAAKTADRLHLLPPVRPDEVVSATRGADVGICLIQDVTLSYRYAMPNKLFEMCFAGIPIVVSNLPEMGQFVTENQVGLIVDQTDPTAISAGIRAAYQRRKELAPDENRLRAIKEKYGWSAQANTLKRLYENLLED